MRKLRDTVSEVTLLVFLQSEIQNQALQLEILVTLLICYSACQKVAHSFPKEAVNYVSAISST